MAIGDDGEVEAAGDGAGLRRVVWAAVTPGMLMAAALLATGAETATHQIAARLLAAYGALLLSFLAGARFGLAVAGNRERDAAVSLVPAVVALAALLLPAPNVYVLLALAFAAQGAWDAFGVGPGALPEWYGRLRTGSTFALVAAMCAAFVATS